MSLNLDLLRLAAANIQTEAERVYEFYQLNTRDRRAYERYANLSRVAKSISALIHDRQETETAIRRTHSRR